MTLSEWAYWNLALCPRGQFRTGVFRNRYPITHPVTFLRQHFEPKCPILRRECIYAFRTFLFPNWQVEWENLKNLSWKITIQQTVEVIQRFGTDKSVPYAPAGKRPIQHPAKFQFSGLRADYDSFTNARRAAISAA